MGLNPCQFTEHLPITANVPASIRFYAVAQESHKMHELKINKLKGVYSLNARLIFQSWLKDIEVHAKDCWITLWETNQLVKDFHQMC